MTAPSATHFNTMDVFRHAATTVAFCCVVAVALTISGRGSWDVQLVYSMSVGLISSAVIHVGWWLLARGEGKFWNRGWQAAGLVLLGTSVGFVVGTLIGDAYTGYSTWALWFLAPSRFASILVISFIATVVVAYFFFSRSKASALEEQIAIAERNASEARLKLLETQLEPHMLFNTLANLRALIQLDAPRAIAMLDHLNNYLRVTLAGSRVLAHPLAAEFARLGDYLELMAIRMGPRLRYTLDLPDDLRDVPVPPLLLQPLVENAIRHGLEPQVKGGEITVRARRQRSTDDGAPQLAIEVNDTGVGLGAAPASNASSGFGLSQVRERLAATYGVRSTLDLIAPTEGGTCATITLPL